MECYYAEHLFISGKLFYFFKAVLVHTILEIVKAGNMWRGKPHSQLILNLDIFSAANCSPDYYNKDKSSGNPDAPLPLVTKVCLYFYHLPPW